MTISPGIVLEQLGSHHRVTLCRLLADGPRTVSELARAAGWSPPVTSHHLTPLRLAGLVASERSGGCAQYRLADPRVVAVLAAAGYGAPVPTEV